MDQPVIQVKIEQNFVQIKMDHNGNVMIVHPDANGMDIAKIQSAMDEIHRRSKEGETYE